MVTIVKKSRVIRHLTTASEQEKTSAEAVYRN